MLNLNFLCMLGWPKGLSFSYKMALLVQVVFNVIFNNFVRLYCDNCHINIKKHNKEFLYSHFNTEDGRKEATFSTYYALFQKR